MADRKLKSWIDQFVQYTSNTEAPEIARRWTAIGTIAAVLEQKVWLRTSAELYPNLYTFIICPPGVGKTQSLNTARKLMQEIPKKGPFIAPTSVNVATLADQMNDSKKSEMGPKLNMLEYNALTILVGEFGTFMSKFEDDMTAMLADFYDVTPYGQRRRGNGGLKMHIERPLLNMMIGATPSVLMKFMPEGAWEQGLTSRVIFIFGDDKGFIDDFNLPSSQDSSDLIHDLTMINDLVGEFHVTEEYAKLVRLWREGNEEPKPTHPRLTHYNTRRKVQLYKLSMIAAIDRGNVLCIDRECFNTAMNWLIEAERRMPQIFKYTSNVDTAAMDEIQYFVLRQNLDKQQTVPEHVLVNYARKKIKPNEVLRVLDVMIHSGMLQVHGAVVPGRRQFIAVEPNLQEAPGQALLQ